MFKRLLGGGVLYRLAATMALALPLAARASINMTNPVTGSTEAYTYYFTGATSGDWNTVGNWANADGTAYSGNIPGAPSSDVWDPLLFDGDRISTAANKTITTSGNIEGWKPQFGFYNGVNVTISTLNKIQSGGADMWFTVDGTSKLTISALGGGHLDGGKIILSSANANGITFSSDFAVNSGNNSGATVFYYLAGDGSIVHQNISACTHTIKQADVTLTGTSQVSSKILVSFASSTKTFTAAADVKIYATGGTTLKKTLAVTSVRASNATIENTVSALTTSDAVGACEIVQCTDGVVLYYVDGDPTAIVPKTYLPSISVNFTSGTALSTAADVGVGDYAIPGTSWNNLIGNNGTLSTVTQVDSTGAASTVAGVGVTISGTRGYWTCGKVLAATDLRQGYIDDAAGANASPQVVVSGIPYYSYYAVVYFSNNDDNVKFGYVTINGTIYKWDDTTSALVECEGADTDSWGASSSSAWTEGGNYIVTPVIVNADGNFTIVSHRLTSARAGIAAIQIVEVPKTAADGELVINVSGDTTYTVSENETYTTVYVTGVGTLAFSGEGTITTTTLNVGAGATVPMGSSITPTTVTGAGTVVYDGAQPSTTVGFNDSARWFGTVWVKNIGSNGESSKVSTVLGTDTATATDNVLKDWGNENSSVKFTNVRGWTGTAVCPWTLILEDDSTNYAWYNNNGYAARSTTFAALKGSGTFYDKSVDSKPCRQKITFTDGSQFTGALYAEGKRVGLGGENTKSDVEDNNGTIEVVNGATATVASGKTWTAGTGSILVTGTLYANGTLAGTSTTRAVRGSGTVVFTGSAPSPTGDAWWKNSNWTGTVQMKSVTLVGTSLAFNDYGNTGSVLELNGCSGWVTPAYTCTVPLKITGTLSLTDGYSDKNNAFKVGTLLGDGTISGSSSAPTMVFNVTTDWSGFTGKIALNNKCVVFGSTIPDTLAQGAIYIAEGAQVTVQNTAEAAWWGVGGIKVDGELRANSLARFGGGTNITTSDNGVFTLVSNSDTDDMNVDYTRIQGTGTLKFEGTNYRTISTNNFPTAMIVENNLNNGLIHRNAGITVSIGSLSGSGQMRSDWGGSGSTGDRDLRILQAKDTTYSGLFASSNDRIDEVYVAPGASTAGTLTLSGAQTASNGLIVETGASVNLTGTWVGATTVSGTFGGTGTLTGDLTFSDGATFKAFATDGVTATDTDGLAVSGTITYPETGKVTVELAEVPVVDTVLITASGLDANKFELASGTAGSLKVEDDNTLVYVTPYAAITVPNVANATVVVTAGGETIQPATAGGTLYGVTPGATVTVTYTAAEGYSFDGATSTFTLENVIGGESVVTDNLVAKPYVAQVRNYGTNQNEDFTSLAAAIAVADGTAYANMITLLADITDAVTIDKAIYLAGQGKTISAAVTISSGGYLSLMGPTLTGKLTIGANGAFAVTGTGSVLPEVETQDGASIALRTLSADTVALTVTTLTVNGTLTLSSTAQGTVRGTPYKAFSYVRANATFGEGAEIVGDGEYSASTDVEGDNTVVSMTITAVAKIGDEYYDDLDEAVADAIANDTVVDLLIQPAAAVTLGVGQTLKVKAYSYTLTVNLATGLTDPPYSISSSLDSETTITTYTVVTASYTVSFVDTDQTVLATAQTVTYNQTATAPSPAPTKENYTFAGWTLGGSAYNFATPVTGDITLVASWTQNTSGGIDPTTDGSTQTVTVDPATYTTEEDQKTAAIAAATVTVPEAVGTTVVDAATYKTYFKLTATATGNEGEYNVSIAGFADTVKTEVDTSVLTAVAAAAATDTEVSVTVKPGLYYGFKVGSALSGVSGEPATVLATDTTATVAKPNSDTAGFIKVRVSTTALAAEE